MATLKTTPNDADVQSFLEGVEHAKRQEDSWKMLEIMREETGHAPKMWGSSIIGYGSYHFVYASGREGDWMLTGFSPRKTSLTVYIMNGFERYDDLLAQLGKFKTGKSCLYVKQLEDVDEGILRQLIRESCQYLLEKYGPGAVK